VKTRRAESLSHCERLVSTLIEMLFQAEERGEQFMDSIKGKKTPKDQVVAVIVTIAVFCEAHPPFALPHLSTLLPYLKVR
jgi:hypothetical protein